MNYFDLTEEANDIDVLTIREVDYFNCTLVNSKTEEAYDGFILAKSPKGNKQTVCDVDFQRSGKDDKYQPRLIFRRTNKALEDTIAQGGAEHVRVSFATGQDGYRQFWKMVFFLYKFKERVDLGDFEGIYQLLTSEQLEKFLNDTANLSKIERVASGLNVEISAVIRSAATLKLLKEFRDKVESFISTGSNEKDVQRWLDEGENKYRQQRCLIFGLEYIGFNREGTASSKRFDILTRVGLKSLEYVLIELKSPSSNIFSRDPRETNNEDTYDYRIHTDLARAIPQILEYRDLLQNKADSDPELEKLGMARKPYIPKCIIVIGKNLDNERWKQNRRNLNNSLSASLEVWTYSDLLNRLDATIENLQANLSEQAPTEDVNLDDIPF